MLKFPALDIAKIINCRYISCVKVVLCKTFLAILMIGWVGTSDVLSLPRCRRVHVKDKSTNSKMPDKTLYMRARTFFANGDIAQARSAINQYLEQYPEDQQAHTLSEMIENQFKNLENNERINTRSGLIEDVEHAWRVPGIVYAAENVTNVVASATDTLRDKLVRIIIPRVRFINLPISNVVEAIAELSVQYDDTTSNSDTKGINVVLISPPTEAEPKINLNLRNITLERLLFYVGQAANYKCDCSSDAVILGEPHAFQEQLETKFFALSRATIIKLTGLQGLNHKSAEDDKQISTFDEEQALKSFFVRAGVDFTVPGSNLAFDGAQLIATNNLANLRRLECILKKYSESKQVEIEAKFLEVTQGTLDELAFRWNIFNRFNADRGSISTGQNGESGEIGTDNLRTMAQAFSPSISSSGNGQIVIDSEIKNLNNQPPKLSGQINLGLNSVPFGSFFGVIDRAQVGMMIRALEQNSGSDLMSAPKLTVLSGRTANIVVAQELRYPQNYGETHSEVGTSSSLASSGSAGVTITAGTPRDFTTRNIGVEMKVTPIVEENDNISLQLEPKVTEFEGFMEYGGSSVAISGGTTVTVPSGFYQPIFSTRAIQTEVTVQNGATVVMGGLTREEVKEVRDKIPVLGDIPLVGRLFRSKSETSQKRNLLIFVTARTVSSNGLRYKPAPQRSNFDMVLDRE